MLAKPPPVRENACNLTGISSKPHSGVHSSFPFDKPFSPPTAQYFATIMTGADDNLHGNENAHFLFSARVQVNSCGLIAVDSDHKRQGTSFEFFLRILCVMKNTWFRKLHFWKFGQTGKTVGRYLPAPKKIGIIDPPLGCRQAFRFIVLKPHRKVDFQHRTLSILRFLEQNRTEFCHFCPVRKGLPRLQSML